MMPAVNGMPQLSQHSTAVVSLVSLTFLKLSKASLDVFDAVQEQQYGLLVLGFQVLVVAEPGQ